MYVDADVVVDVDVDGAGAGVGGVLAAGVVYEREVSHESFGQIGDSTAISACSFLSTVGSVSVLPNINYYELVSPAQPNPPTT